MFPSYLNTVAAFVERKKWKPAIWRPKNVVHNRSKEKDYNIYLKSEKWFTASRSTKKMFPSYLEVGKTGSQLFRA